MCCGLKSEWGGRRREQDTKEGNEQRRVPFIIWVVNVCRKQLRVLFTAIRESLSELNGVFTEHIYGMAEIQRFGAQKQASQRFDVLSLEFMNQYHRANWWDAGLYAIMDGLSSLSVGLVIGYLAFQTGVGQELGVSIGSIVALIDALNRIFKSSF